MGKSGNEKEWTRRGMRRRGRRMGSGGDRSLLGQREAYYVQYASIVDRSSIDIGNQMTNRIVRAADQITLLSVARKGQHNRRATEAQMKAQWRKRVYWIEAVDDDEEDDECLCSYEHLDDASYAEFKPRSPR